MIKVSTTGMVVSLKTDLRFPIPGQQGHGGRIIHGKAPAQGEVLIKQEQLYRDLDVKPSLARQK